MLKSVKVPTQFVEIFQKAENYVEDYFKKLSFRPENGSIDIDGERYILVRASAMSVNFLEFIKEMYPGLTERGAINASCKVLFEMAKSFGISDAKNFHAKQNLTEPIERLSTGPVHFAFTGWANVEFDDSSNPTPDENYYILYDHPNSFEADCWIKEGKRTDFCTCFMNAGYSSGWCQESFGLELKAQEITCRAKGDDQCRFIMAQPHRLNEFIEKYKRENPKLFQG